VPIYTSNPSVPSADEIKKTKRTRLGTELRGLVVDNGSGEVLGHGGAMVYEWEEVDKERFVKLYLSPYNGTFFVNIRFMFNGDRTYRL
jgi:hypothetical protein